MTSKVSKPAAPFLPYRKILPEGFICPQPEYLREDMLQAEPNDESGHLLRDHYSGQPSTLVDTGGFVFYDPNDLNRGRVRPDVYVVFGVDTGAVFERAGYVIYEAGKPPDFTLEIASFSTRRRDTGYKRALYAKIGFGEYWRFDPTGGRQYGYPLAGDILTDGVYQPVDLTLEDDGMLWGHSPALDLCLCARGRRLIYYDRKTGNYLQTVGEERAAHRHTTAERDQAAAERDVAQAEVERLREELRRLHGQ